MFASVLSCRSPAYVLDTDGMLVNEGVANSGASVSHLERRVAPYVILSNTGTRTGVEVAHSLSSTIGTPIPTVNVITARDQMLESMTATDVLYQRFVVVEDGGDACPPPRPDDDVSAVCVALFTDGNVPDYMRTIAHVAQWVRRGAALWITSCDTTIMRANSEGVDIPHPGPGIVLQCVQALLPSPADVRIFGKGDTPQFPEDVAGMIACNVQDLAISHPNAPHGRPVSEWVAQRMLRRTNVGLHSNPQF